MSNASTTTASKSENTNQESTPSNVSQNGSAPAPVKLNAKASEFVPSFAKPQGALKSTAAPFVPGGPAMGGGIPQGAGAPLPIPMGVPMMQGAYPGAPVMYMAPPMMPPYGVGGPYMSMGNYPINPAGMPYPPAQYYGVPPPMQQQQQAQHQQQQQQHGGVVVNSNNNSNKSAAENTTTVVDDKTSDKGAADKTPQKPAAAPVTAEHPEVLIRFGDVTPQAVKIDPSKSSSVVVASGGDIKKQSDEQSSVDSVVQDLAKASLNDATNSATGTLPVESKQQTTKKVEELTLSQPAAATGESSTRDDDATSTNAGGAARKNGTTLTVNTAAAATPSGYEGDADTEPNSESSSPRPNYSSDDLAGQAKKAASGAAAGWRGQTPKATGTTTGSAAAAAAAIPSGPNSARGESGGRDANWRRGEVGAETVQTLLGRSGKDGVTRYDKVALLNLFKRGANSCPETFKGVFPAPNVSPVEHIPIAMAIQQQQQSPRGGGGGGSGGGGGGGNKQGGGGGGGRGSGRNNKGGVDPRDEPHPDEQIIFAKENMEREGTFKYQPSRLQDTTTPEAILAKAKLILNKLSLTNFDKLADEFMQAGLDSEELMGKAVEMIVVCAQMNEHFSNMYADLCRKITDEWSRGSTEEEESLGKSFRVRLLNRCQEEFSVDRVKKLEEIRAMEIPPEDKEEKVTILKKSYTGHMRFIGEIYMKGLVRANIMHNCIAELMQNSEEEVLVCMIKLLTTIGQELEKYDLRKQRKHVATYFKQIEKMAVEHSSSRMRYMLRDLLELRKNGWVARRETEKAKKLSDIRAEDSNNPSNSAPGNSAKSPRGGPANPAAAPSNTPRGSQDARNFSAANRSSERLSDTAAATAAAPAPVDEWQTVSSTKNKSGKGSGPNTAAPSAGSQSSSSFGNSSGKGGVGGAFAALGGGGGGKRPPTTGGSNAKPSSSGGNSVRDRDNRDRGGGGDSRGDRSSRNDGRTSPRGGGGGEAKNKPTSPATPAAASTAAVAAEESAIPSSAAADKEISSTSDSSSTLPGANGTSVDKETLRRVRAAVEEYFINGLDNEALEVLKELVHPDGMGDAVKSCIQLVFEKKSEDREKLGTLFIALHSSGFLTSEQAKRGVLAFLDEFDDIVIDVPLAGTYGAAILAHLVVSNVIDLAFLASVPEDNMFASSPRAAEFMGHTLKAIAESPIGAGGGAERAEAIYRESGLNILDKIEPIPRQSEEEAVAEFISKYNLPFLKTAV